MKKIASIIALSASLVTNTALAGTMGPVGMQPKWQWVGTISGGPIWADGGETQTFYLAPEIEKTYTIENGNSILGEGELFIGLQRNFLTQFQLQLGVAVAAMSDAKLEGNIWDDADPEFNNHIYDYKIAHTHVLAKGKLLLDRGYGFLPWISAGVGPGFNRAHDFNNEPIICEALANPNFTNQTKTALTYTLGAGIQKILSPHWQVGVGYEFADWGNSELGAAPGQTLNSGLSLNHFYTNGLLFNLTFLA